MLSAVLASPRQIQLRPVALPEPQPGQVRIRIDGCGVCGSDLPVWLGRPWFDYPRAPGAPGHEAWGTIDAVGAESGGLQVGDPVVCLTYRSYAEFDLADASTVVALPAGLTGAAFPGEPLACAMNIMRRSGIERDSTVAVVGIGFLGSLLTRLACARGAHVIAIGRRASSLELAQSAGAEPLLARGDDLPHRVNMLTHGQLCDVVIEAAGAQATLDLAAQLVRVRGRLVIAGYHQDGPRSVDMQQWNWNGIDVINAHERDLAAYHTGLELAVREVAAGRLDPGPLFTHEFGLDELSGAFRALEQHPDGFIKALVRC